MDTHLPPDGRLGRHLPAGYGSRGKEAISQAPPRSKFSSLTVSRLRR